MPTSETSGVSYTSNTQHSRTEIIYLWKRQKCCYISASQDLFIKTENKNTCREYDNVSLTQRANNVLPPLWCKQEILSSDLLLPNHVPIGEERALADVQVRFLLSHGGGTWVNSKTGGQWWWSHSLTTFCTCDEGAPVADFPTTAYSLGRQGCRLVRNHFGSRVDQMDLGREVGYLYCPHFRQRSS